MPIRVAKNDTSLQVRIDSRTSKRMELARRYINLDKRKFVRESVREKAEAVIAQYEKYEKYENHEKTCFTSEDWLMFFDMLDHSLEPTDRMKKAIKKYREITSSHAI